VRLLLDEHYSPEIARQLRDRGHDVLSASERVDLVGLPDAELLSRMAIEGRAIVTEDWADFSRLMTDAAVTGTRHYGVLFTSRRRLPRERAAIGLVVRTLGDFLDRHPDEEALANEYRWLPESAND
jgi:hypothetical protein